MANDEHLAILKQGVEVWNEWRKHNSEIQPDLGSASLSNLNLIEADLSGANLGFADLGGTDLTYADLSGANLTFAILNGAVLYRATLHYANLIIADLRGTDLAYADLSEAILSGATLREADLRRATLREVIFREAILIFANFTEAICGSTLFADVDLSEVKGLETIQHDAPSTVGIDTLYKSKGKIPEIFLQGCGVPQTLLDYFRSHPISKTDQLQCFVSHSSKDEDLAKKLDEELEHHGIRCWLYQRDMKPMEGPREGMRQGFDDSDVMLLCCSKDSLGSQYVKEEILMALDKEGELFKRDGKDTNIMVVLDLDGHIFSPTCSHPLRSQIKAHQIIDFKGDFEQGLNQLLRHLRRE